MSEADPPFFASGSPGFSSGNAAPDAFELVHGFVTASLQGELTDGEVEDFEVLLRDNAELRRVYARYLETTAHIPRLLAALPSISSSEGNDGSFDLAELSSSLPLSPQLRSKQSRSQAGAARSGSPVLGFLNGLLHAGRETPAANALTWVVLAVICSGMVLTVFFCISLAIRGVGVHVHVDRPELAGDHPDPGAVGRQEAGSPPSLPSSFLPASNATVARLIHTAESRWAIGSHSPHEGDDLEPGRKLVLLSGLAEVMFQSGARAVLQGPATLEIGSRKSAMLRQGKLAVRIEDADARGFEVYTPGMRYTDLGTEFGVWVKKDGTQEMLVYRGSVQAEGARDWGLGASESATSDDSPQPPVPSPQPLILSANQAIRVAGPGKTVERIEGEPGMLGGERFVRAMPAPVPFAVCSTGFGLDRGAADPHWELADISTDADFKPQPAVVADPLPIYFRPGQGAAQGPQPQWIGKSQSLRLMPDACRCTYRTRFDLNGFDPSTARIEGRILADDYVVEIRLNGKTVPAPAGARGPNRYAKWLEFKIEEGFADGDNTLEIVIENSSHAQKGYVNTMALCVECKGTARPLLALEPEK